MSVAKLKGVMALTGTALLAAAMPASAAVTVTVDPTVMTSGYMSFFELPVVPEAQTGPYVDGGRWAQADLNSSVNGGVLTLMPNISIDQKDQSEFWWGNPPMSPTGNKIMAASYYGESDPIAGELVTFTGTVLSNTLVAPYATTIFIKDFSSSYSLLNVVSVPATAGEFSISLQTTPGGHIQWGFETVGPNAREATVAQFGNVQIAVVVPEPAGMGAVAVAMMALAGRRRR